MPWLNRLLTPESTADPILGERRLLFDANRSENLLVDLVGMALGRDRENQSFLTKHIDDGLRLTSIVGKTLPNSLGGIIGPGRQLPAAKITNVLDLRRSKVNGKVLPATVAEPSTEDSLAECFFADFEQDGGIESMMRQKKLRLTGGTRKSIEHETLGDVWLAESVGDDLIDNLVGDELTGFHVVANFLSDGTVVGHVPAENFPHRDGDNSQVGRQASSLRPLTASLRPHDDVVVQSRPRLERSPFRRELQVACTTMPNDPLRFGPTANRGDANLFRIEPVDPVAATVDPAHPFVHLPFVKVDVLFRPRAGRISPLFQHREKKSPGPILPC
jgi:hypothetical protein